MVSMSIWISGGLIGKERVELLFVGRDRRIEHFLNALHRAGDVLSAKLLRAHAVVGVEQADRCGEIEVEKLPDLRHIGGIVDSVADDLVGNAHQLVDPAADLRVGGWRRTAGPSP